MRSAWVTQGAWSGLGGAVTCEVKVLAQGRRARMIRRRAGGFTLHSIIFETVPRLPLGMEADDRTRSEAGGGGSLRTRVAVKALRNPSSAAGQMKEG